jgi:hypothetical protein
MTNPNTTRDLGWCILRTSGRNTLALADHLKREGFEVWTPVDHQPRRLPRRKQRVERQAPLMPTFVFAKASALADLIALSEQPGRPIGFSLFRDGRRVPAIEDGELDALRGEETRSLARCRKAMQAGRRSTRVYARGETVRVPEGSFGGMTGIVETSDGRFTLVCFGGAMSVKISTWLLAPDESYSGPAARAA